MIYDNLIKQIKKVLESLQMDDVGKDFGAGYQGGGGGLLSNDTIHQAGLLRLELSKLERPTHQHIKRGSKYRFIGYAHMQSDRWVEFGGDSAPSLSVDMRIVAVYEAVDESNPGMRLWVRPAEEFDDPERFRVL